MATDAQVTGWINAASRETGVSPALIRAVMMTESGGRVDAVSPAGAIGLMQLMPATAAGLGVNPRDPAQNVLGGARYLAQQLRAFGGDVPKALAAYNAGPGAVRRYGGIPPYAETRTYVQRVMGRLGTSSPTTSRPASSPATVSPIRGDWTNLGGVSGHMSRALGNWQSDHAVDMGVPAGTPVYAPFSGVVVRAGNQGSSGTTAGARVGIQGTSMSAFLGHLDPGRLAVREGDRVQAGQLLGYVGRFPQFPEHLHFGLARGSYSTGSGIDPMPFLRGAGTASGTVAAGGGSQGFGFGDALDTAGDVLGSAGDALNPIGAVAGIVQEVMRWLGAGAVQIAAFLVIGAVAVYLLAIGISRASSTPLAVPTPAGPVPLPGGAK